MWTPQSAIDHLYHLALSEGVNFIHGRLRGWDINERCLMGYLIPEETLRQLVNSSLGTTGLSLIPATRPIVEALGKDLVSDLILLNDNSTSGSSRDCARSLIRIGLRDLAYRYQLEDPARQIPVELPVESVKEVMDASGQD